jgi:formylglycine-generating enzyme required for sulfatase activity
MKKMLFSIFLLVIVLIIAVAVGAQTSTSTDFVFIQGGTIIMGSPVSERDRYNNEGPQHQVTVSSFYMGKYEVTQKEYQEVMGSNPSYFKGDNLPVENVNWYEAIAYCNQRSLNEGLTPAYRGSGDNIIFDREASGYHLPTEAEWEYAAKGGNRDSNIYLYAGSNDAETVGWYDRNSEGTSRPVGSKAPNTLGLYDMSGNVGEMCWDRHGNYGEENQANPTGAVSGTSRVGRGGCWYYGVQFLRTSFRAYINPSVRYSYVGFRLVRSAK